MGAEVALPRLVMVEWLDSRQPTAGWSHLSDLQGLTACKCLSVGFLIEEADGYKVLAPNVADMSDEEGAQASGAIVIPDCAVKRVVDLVETSDAPHD